jgi:phosphatidylglycerol:prolipoprotein diacylglycerol transferase
MGTIPFAYLINLGWLRIGPPYIYLNIDPVIVHLGPLALRWYGLMYVVGIIMGLWAIKGYTERKGVSQELVYRVLWWCIAAGLIGGRLYFVVQQPNFFSYYLAQPWHIIATWEGGMAFFGAIFLIIPTLYWRARVERVNPLVLVDAGVLFASVGQIFGRFGNIVNGDIIGYRSTLPWSTVYLNPNSWACLNPATCKVPVQPAAVYEILLNIILLCVLFYLARRVTRPGTLALVYLFGYCITQFLVFFVRDNIYVDFLGTTALKQAQWTAIITFIVMLPIAYLVMRWHYSQPVPAGEVAATYGIPQKPDAKAELETLEAEDDEEVDEQLESEEDEEDEESVEALNGHNAEAEVEAQDQRAAGDEIAADESEESEADEEADGATGEETEAAPGT